MATARTPLHSTDFLSLSYEIAPSSVSLWPTEAEANNRQNVLVYKIIKIQNTKYQNKGKVYKV